MNKTFCLFLAVFLSYMVCGQNFTQVYSDNNGNTYTGALNRIETDALGNVYNSTTYSNAPITIGDITFPIQGNLCSVIIKRDAEGTLLWARSLACGYTALVSDLCADSEGNLYVTGFFGNPQTVSTLNSTPFELEGAVGMSFFLLKYNPAGEILWSRSGLVGTTGGDFSSDLFHVAGNNAGQIAICAPFKNVGVQTIGGTQISTSNANMFIAGLSDGGDWQFVNPIGTSTNTYIGFSIDVADNGDVFCAGSFKGTLSLGLAGTLDNNSSSTHEFIFKSDFGGTYQWAYSFPFDTYWGNQVVCSGNDAVLFGSYSGTVNFLGTELTSPQQVFSTYATKFSNPGDVVWASSYGTEQTTFFRACDAGDGFYIFGNTAAWVNSNTFGSYELVYSNTLPPENTLTAIDYLIRTDAEGNVMHGAACSFAFNTLNCEDLASGIENAYITGNVGQQAAFGHYTLIAAQTNGSNYIARFSEDNNFISGKSFFDMNLNGLFDNGEDMAPVILKLESESQDAFVCVSDDFLIGTGTGEYHIFPVQIPLYYSLITADYTVDFGQGTGQTSFGNDFVFQPEPDMNDLVVDAIADAFRPGFDAIVWVHLRNAGTTPQIGNIHFTISHPDVEITDVYPEVSVDEPSEIELPFDLQPMQQVQYRITCHVDAGAPLASQVLAVAATPSDSDETPLNNSDTLAITITGSYDPNDKLADPGDYIYPDFIAANHAIEYTVRFQNTGNDTAFTVAVVDTLSEKLDLSSFEPVSFSHPVQITMHDHVIWFRFNNINLPDENTNEAASHGYVKFRIRPSGDIAFGDIISNIARIYFDYNIAVMTNETQVEYADYSWNSPINQLETIKIWPNPVSDGLFYLESGDGLIRCDIISCDGRLLYSQPCHGEREILVHPGHISNGFYIVQVLTKSGIQSTVLHFTK